MRLAIAVPTHRPEISKNEEIALRQLVSVLGHYPIRIICPRSMDTSAYRKISRDFQFDKVPDFWMKSLYTYNCLMLSRYFYRKFLEYEWLMIYQTDAFVFSNQAEHWMNQNIDFIGAPWFDGHDTAEGSRSDLIVGAGNSGFCMKRVDSFLRVLYEKTLPDRLYRYARNVYHTLKRDGAKPAVDAALSGQELFYFSYEDVYWAKSVPARFPWFRVAPPAQAMHFSFEDRPRTLYRRTGNQLPFGCHAWERYDFEFWRPFIEKFGYELAPPVSMRATG